MIAQLFDSIHAISRTDWDSIYKTDYPFLRYDFLAALEDSQSVSEKSGWQIAHIRRLRSAEVNRFYARLLQNPFVRRICI